MTNEQREAIEKLRERFEPDKFGGICALGYKNKYCFGKSDLQAIDTVLSLIKEQQEQIDKKDKQIDLMAKKINEAYCDETSFYNWFEKTFGIRAEGDYSKEIKQYFAGLVEKE